MTEPTTQGAQKPATAEPATHGAQASAAEATSKFTPKRLYGFFAFAETVTWTMLITAMIAKYGFDYDALILPFGLSHGLIFVSYGATAILVGMNQRWRARLVLAAIATAVIPYATIPFDRWLARRGLLDGAWRTEASDDPRDQRAIDRLLRWGLRNPILLFGGIAIAIAVVVTVLLQLGPPTEWGN